MLNKTHAIGQALCLAMVAAAPQSVEAATLIGAGSLPGGNKIHLPATNQTGVGPFAFDGVTFQSNTATALFGWTGAYNYGNGVAQPGVPIMAVNRGNLNGDYADMFLYLPNNTTGFLAELFWTNGTSAPVSAFFGAYNSSGALLDFFELNNNGSFNGRTAGYYGFSRPANDIAYLRFSNSFIGARNLTWIGREVNAPVAGVPEPGTWIMMILGFGLIGGAMRRRKARTHTRVKFG